MFKKAKSLEDQYNYFDESVVRGCKHLSILQFSFDLFNPFSFLPVRIKKVKLIYVIGLNLPRLVSFAAFVFVVRLVVLTCSWFCVAGEFKLRRA